MRLPSCRTHSSSRSNTPRAPWGPVFERDEDRLALGIVRAPLKRTVFGSRAKRRLSRKASNGGSGLRRAPSGGERRLTNPKHRKWVPSAHLVPSPRRCPLEGGSMGARSRQTRDAPHSATQNRSRPLPCSLYVDVVHRAFSRSRFWVLPAWRQSTSAPEAWCGRTKAGSNQPSPMRRKTSPAGFSPTGLACRSSISGCVSNPRCSETRSARAKRNDAPDRWANTSDTRVVDGLAVDHRDRHGERHRLRRGDRPDLSARRMATGLARRRLAALGT